MLRVVATAAGFALAAMFCSPAAGQVGDAEIHKADALKHFDCAVPGSFGVSPSSPAVADVVPDVRFRALIEVLLRQSSIPGAGEYCIEIGGSADVVAAGSEVVLFWELDTFGLYKAHDTDDQLVAVGWGHDGAWIKRPHANRSELWEDMQRELAEAVAKLERDWRISHDE